MAKKLIPDPELEQLVRELNETDGSVERRPPRAPISREEPAAEAAAAPQETVESPLVDALEQAGKRARRKTT